MLHDHAAHYPDNTPSPYSANDTCHEYRCAEEGDLRLLDQVEVNGYVTGALQVFRDGDFGTVCTAGFRDAEAQVACRQLGFIGGGFLQFARPSPGLTDAQLQVRLTCTSTLCSSFAAGTACWTSPRPPKVDARSSGCVRRLSCYASLCNTAYRDMF